MTTPLKTIPCHYCGKKFADDRARWSHTKDAHKGKKNPRPVIDDDEPSFAERAIQAELQSAAQNKTTLVIAHRLSTVVDAHEILVMDAGRIIERGTHSQLLALGARYAQMWALQQNTEPSLASTV